MNREIKTAVFPGTFDPPTLGHMDVVMRGMNGCTKRAYGTDS